MAEQKGIERSPDLSGRAQAADLLRAALEKVVFFEWRVSELSSQLAQAEERASAAARQAALAVEERSVAEHRARTAEARAAAAEEERGRLSTLLGAARLEPAADRERIVALEASLADASAEIVRQREERERWLSDMVAQARAGGEGPAALAGFISELRGEVISLRERVRQDDALLRGADRAVDSRRADRAAMVPPIQVAVGLDGGGTPAAPPLPTAREIDARLAPPPPVSEIDAPLAPPPPVSEIDAPLAPRPTVSEIDAPLAPRPIVSEIDAPLAPRPTVSEIDARLARPSLLDSGPDRRSAPPDTRRGTAAQALSDQSLRQLDSSDPERRARAARNLAAVPAPAAAPALAVALSRERDPRVRAALALALVACGGDGAAALVAQLQLPPEAAVVRVAALDALCSAGAEQARLALSRAAQDDSPAVRRRAAMLAFTEGADQIVAALARDSDASVRAATRRLEAPDAGPSVPIPAAPSAAIAAPARTFPAAPAYAPAEPDENLARDAVAAVRAAIFGLSEDELARQLEVPDEAAAALAARLVADGVVARRGKRLVAAGAPEGGP